MNNIHNAKAIDISLFHRIDINLYPLFIAVFEQRSISKAAQMLCVSQSAASHALQRLRQQLNDEVFIRSGQHMLPTPFAENIYLPIKTALLTLQNISIQQQPFVPGMLKKLRIAIHDEIEPIILPRLIRHFQSLQLDLQFFSSKLDRKNVVSDLATQQIDFFIDLEQNFGEKIRFQSLVKDRFVLCSQRHIINAKEYSDAMHIGVSSRRTGTLLEDIYLKHQQISRQVVLRCQQYSTALQILQHQPFWILSIPQLILQHLNYAENIHVSDFPFELPEISIGIYWHDLMNDNVRHSFLRDEIFKNIA